jgi:peptide/nickel transport system substrate-binding protein
MVKDVPAIPLMAATAFGEYTTTHAVGWPSATDPYETPAPGSPWDEVVVLRLRPAS